MAYYSPLRYPGGKGKMLQETLNIIENNNLQGCTYIEPFAGGSNLALNLLFTGIANRIILNDADPAIYAVWHSILNHGPEFITFIRNISINIEEYSHQKEIYNGAYTSLLELGLATFYLNRTNRSGIIKAGPIGGYNQNGNYLIDCRFNREDLSKRVNRIYESRHLIDIYNDDARDFLLLNHPENSFFFIDPPYYNKGASLYRNFFNHNDHVEISNIVRNLEYPWIVTYDNVEPVLQMYDFSQHIDYDISYTVETKRIGNEIMFYSNAINM